MACGCNRHKDSAPCGAHKHEEVCTHNVQQASAAIAAAANASCTQHPCRIKASSGCSKTARECAPIAEYYCQEEQQFEVCRDSNGLCKLYPKCCRNRFWPEFAHPTWLCCDALYCHCK